VRVIVFRRIGRGAVAGHGLGCHAPTSSKRQGMYNLRNRNLRWRRFNGPQG
jgi:hypothetical protein